MDRRALTRFSTSYTNTGAGTQMAHVLRRHHDLTLRTSQHLLRVRLLISVVLIANCIFIIVILIIISVVALSIEEQRGLLILIAALCFSYSCKFTARNSSGGT